SRDPDTMLVDPRPGMGDHIRANGIKISGQLNYEVPVRNFFERIEMLKESDPNLIFLSTKTFHLPRVMEDLKSIVKPGTKIVSTHNGLGTEDVIADNFGKESAFRMSLNYGVSLTGMSEVTTAFFNRPNHLGPLTSNNMQLGLRIAEMLSSAGLDTECVEDIKLYVWKKMIMKCTMASICAATDRTLKEVLDFPPTREIADNCFAEILAVAEAQGYDLGPHYLKTALGYLEKAGAHKDSMCYDIANKAPTEIDFLGGKVVEYARKVGVPVPYFTVMANIVKAIEDGYLQKR
ncbi:MAG: 2-dehydropantoate 2-reductase, partial [Pseudomonadota bacterium]